MRPPQIADSGLMSQMGIINAFRTGNPVLDVFLCMVIPVIMQFLFKSTSNLSPAIMKYLERFRNPKPDYVRIITFERTMSDNGCELDNGGVPSRNSILQKAILMYLDTLDIDYTTSRVQLMAIKEQQLYDRRRMRLPYGTTSEQLKCYNVTISPPVGTWVMLLPGLEFKMTRDTASDEASTSNKKQVNNQGNGGEGKVKQFTTTFEFRANTGSRPKSKHLVEQFIRDAFQWYVDRMTELTNPTRYLYMLAAESKAANPSPTPPRNPTSTSQGTKYNRYPLCGEKTFDTLFFPRKDNLLKLLNDFVNKTGKYQIKGYPHRLGLLLHGPPGSGKTSLAKAIAERTGRNVVSIPLGRIKTNAQLYNIVFDKVYKVPDEDMPVKLGFEDIIFVMEDIDCASDVVHRREGSQIVQRSKQQTILHNRSRASLKRTCGVLQAILKDGQEGIDFEKALSEGASMICDETSTLPTSDSETSLDMVESSSNIQEQIETQEEAECEPPETASSPKQVDVLSTSEECEGHDDEANQERMPKVKSSSSAKHEEALMARGLANLLSSAGKGDSKDGDSPFVTLREREESDKLDLSGILNVLDGIVETPNRILIMTSNHPELLDPALIRPGRIDKRIMLDYAKPAEIIEMINHYFGPMLEQREIIDGETGQLTHLECQVIETLFQHNAVKWTAAQIEQLCAEHDYVEDFLMDLVQQVGEHPVLDDFI